MTELTEFREAMRALQAWAAPHRFRVVRTAEGLPVLPDRLGVIEYDGYDLTVFSSSPGMRARLSAVPGLRVLQVGDREVRAAFPPEALVMVAGLVKTRRRRSADLPRPVGTPFRSGCTTVRALA
jgi:hypothetical protein